MFDLILQPFSLAVAASLATAFLVAGLLGSGLARRLLDVPVERSLHARPISRAGGLAIWAGFALVCLGVGGQGIPVTLWVSLSAVFLISVLDDHKALPASLRLLVHTLAASVWAIHLIGFHALVLPSILAVAWMTNLFNFMDGSDGLAAGMALAGFSVLGLVAAAGAHAIAVPAFAAAGAAAGFLLFNFPPARLFMGDAGSVPLGFLAGALGLWGVHDGLWSVWVPVLAFAPFILDASATLLLRVLRGQKPWEAHREHLYQLLILQGWSHRRLLAFAYPVMAGCTGLVWLLFWAAPGAVQLWGPVTCLSLATLYVLARIRLARPAQDAG